MSIIGLQRGAVQLVPYNPKWAELFDQEQKLLKSAFGNTIIAIEHIGSTAIPGIPAKPILDILVGVRDLEIAGNMKDTFEQLGYEHRSFLERHTKEDVQWEELYVKGAESKRTHYVHVVVYGGKHWKDDLLFRDYLQTHPEQAMQYAELKQKLADQYAHDRKTYTKMKQEYIDMVCKLAEKES